jgi:hypothetical protein
MKKLVVLSALLGLLALPMFASDFSFGGDTTFGFVSGLSGDAGTYAEKTDLTFDIKAKLDDFNSLVINMDGLEKIGLVSVTTTYTDTNGDDVDVTDTYYNGPGILKALWTTDLGKWLGLPVGVKVAWGYDDPDWNAFGDITNYGNTGVYLSPAEYWGIDFLVSYKMLEFELAFNPGISGNGDLGYLLAGLAVKEPIKGLNAEVYFFQDATAIDVFDDAEIAFDAAYALELGGIGLTVAPVFKYDMDETYFWGLGLQGTFDMFTANLGVSGDDANFLNWLDFDVSAAVLEKLDVYAGVELELAEGGDVFQGLDIGVNANIGAVDCQLGYVVTEFGEGEIDGWFSLPVDGGFYVLFDVNY